MPSTRSVRRVIPNRAEHLDDLLARLQRGGADPSVQRYGAAWLRTTNTPDGPSLTTLHVSGADVVVEACGPGARWAADHADRLLGSDDGPAAFDEYSALLPERYRRHRPIVIGATDEPVQATVSAIIEQRVTGAEAFQSHHRLIRKYGTTMAHDPVRMWAFPSAERLAEIPSWEWTQLGVDAQRAHAIGAYLKRRTAIDRAVGRGASAVEALQTIRGIGPWTAAKVAQSAYGDADAWSVDDYHAPAWISQALTGTKLNSQETDALLEPFRPHRYRVELLIGQSAPHHERRGPRRTLPTHVPGIG